MALSRFEAEMVGCWPFFRAEEPDQNKKDLSAIDHRSTRKKNNIPNDPDASAN